MAKVNRASLLDTRNTRGTCKHQPCLYGSYVQYQRGAEHQHFSATMDASEDDDIKLQRKAADFIEDLSQSLKPFLWKTTKSGKTAIRRRVRVRDADRLVNLVWSFSSSASEPS